MGASIQVTLTPNALALLGYEPKAENCSAAPIEIREDVLESLLKSARPAASTSATVPLADIPVLVDASALAPRPSITSALSPARSSTPASIKNVADQAVPTSMLRGLHDEPALERLTKSALKISGLVVSIARASDSGPAGSRLIHQLIADFLAPEDFACNINAEEFLLYFPNQRGAEAQRRVRLIAQRLWDLQLNILDTGAAPFAWGAVEVHQEPLEDAFAAARERMNETLRMRSGFLERAAPK